MSPRNHVADLVAKLQRGEEQGLAIYGLCTWWNDAAAGFAQMNGPRTELLPAAGRAPGELPRCPYCGSPLYQGPLGDFIAAIDQADEPERSAWHWQRGRSCFRSREQMVDAYLAELEPPR